MLRLDHIILDYEAFRLSADWQVAPGTKLALIGPSGAGKSSLLAAIAGFFRPSAGRVLWQGQDITDLPPGQRPLSILFQDQNLFPHLTLAQNLGLGIRPNLRLSPAEQAQIDTALDRVGLPGMGARKPGQLSGGQISRAGLARMVLRARPLLLLDEPFAALGPALKQDMLDLLAQVASESQATVLMVTHDPRDALLFADQSVVVAEGLAAPPMATAALFDAPPKALQDYLGGAIRP